MNRKILHNLISAAIFIVLFIVVRFFTSSLDPDSSLFPRMASWVMVVLSFGLIGQSLWVQQREKRRASDKERLSEASIGFRQRVYPFVVVVFCILFLISFNIIGFELSSALLMFMIMLLLDWKKGLRKFYFALAVPAVFILIFKVGLKLRIPLLLDRIF